MLNEKQRPDTCGNLPLAPGIELTPFSSIVFSSAPFTSSVATTLPNGSTASTCPRVIWYGGGVNAGQNPVPPPACGHVSLSRRPPEFVIANSTPIEAYLARIASVVTSPTRDSQRRPSERPHTSARRISTDELPITVPRIGCSSAVSSSTR